jgi:uncharacterized membrane protein HdeD (DUF308 family)
MLFLFEGVALVALGLLAIVIPSIAGSAVTLFLGWLFLISGLIGLVTTFRARHIPGFWWSLVSALLATIVGVVLIAHRSQDLYGGLVGWPLATVGPLRMVLVLFFLIEGGASIMFATEHRRAGQWAWMLASGVLDIVLASVIILDLPGSSAWTMGLLIGINMIAGGASLIAMGLHARSGRSGIQMGSSNDQVSRAPRVTFRRWRLMKHIQPVLWLTIGALLLIASPASASWVCTAHNDTGQKWTVTKPNRAVAASTRPAAQGNFARRATQIPVTASLAVGGWLERLIGQPLGAREQTDAQPRTS